MAFSYYESVINQSKFPYLVHSNMANLNEHDILFLGSPEFESLPQILEEAYGFKIRSYDLPPFVSFTSRKAVLNTDSGAYFLKEKPVYCSDEKARALAADFQTFLSEELDTVTPILKTQNGESYIQWQGRFFFITDFKPGRVFNGSDSDIHQMLLALKDFQEAAKSFSTESVQPTKSYEPLVIFELLEKNIENKAGIKEIAQIKKLMEVLQHDYDAVPETEHIMSHGDFALFNILLNGKSIVGINDFDNVSYLPRVHDLAEFLVSASIVHYLGPISNLRLPVFTQPNKKIFNQILAFYKQCFSFTAEETLLLAIVAEIVWLEILLLAVLKGDYKLSDISEAVNEIKKGALRSKILEKLHSQEKKVFIWDFHGTLETGTLFILTEIANTLLKENGSTKQYTPAEFASIPSFSWDTFFQKHFPHLSVNETQAIAQSAYDEKKFAPLMEKYSRPNIGAEAVLQKIKSGGGVNIVVSHSRQDKLGYYIDQTRLSHLIDDYYGIDDGSITSREDVLKKKTAVIREILDQHNGSRSHAVGDADMDFNAARSADVDMFYWLLPTNNKEAKQGLYKGISSQKLKFIIQLEEISQDL